MLFMQADPSDPFSAKHFTIQGLFDGAGWLAKALLTAQTSDIASPDVTVELEALIPKELSKNSVKGMSSTFNSYVNTLRFNETYLSDDELQTASSSNASCGLVRNWLIRFNEKAIERLNCILRTVAEAEIIPRTPLCDAQSGAPLAVNFCRGGVRLEIQSANDAVVSLLALPSQVEMQLARPTLTDECVLLLDEPELHLNPVIQATVAEYIAEISRTANAQVILVTHSDHIVHRLRQYSDSAILNIER